MQTVIDFILYWITYAGALCLVVLVQGAFVAAAIGLFLLFLRLWHLLGLPLE